MRQLQLFTTAQLSTMRDRTKRRNYSAEADEFRREHEKRRAWGLTQRHARKLHRVYGHIPADEEIKARWNERIAAASTCRRPEPDPPPNSEAAIAKPPHPEAAIAKPPHPETATAQPPHPETATAQPPHPETATAQPPHPETATAQPAPSSIAASTTAPYSSPDCEPRVSMRAANAAACPAGPDTTAGFDDPTVNPEPTCETAPTPGQAVTTRFAENGPKPAPETYIKSPERQPRRRRKPGECSRTAHQTPGRDYRFEHTRTANCRRPRRSRTGRDPPTCPRLLDI
ncbi:hypothetical protein SAMN06264365_107377 [Actinoplanes regularis]|uniref:Uncharacterized protein n=1 Tax=Actinoplanes regularis TaxID=52697 RepID=A0A239AKF4_9ACTN|nr:hypothetical protein SAMN06264365_107377 [Actinoplanes regularis]